MSLQRLTSQIQKSEMTQQMAVTTGSIYGTFELLLGTPEFGQVRALTVDEHLITAVPFTYTHCL